MRIQECHARRVVAERHHDGVYAALLSALRGRPTASEEIVTDVFP